MVQLKQWFSWKNDSNNQQPKQWFKQNREQRITYLEGERFLREWKQGRIGNEEEETNKKNQGRSNKELAPTKEEEQQQQGRRSVNEGRSDSYGWVTFFYSEKVKCILALSPWLLGVPIKILGAQNKLFLNKIIPACTHKKKRKENIVLCSL